MNSTRLRAASDRVRAAWSDPSERAGLVLLLLGLASLAVSMLTALSIRSPLGHDESVYALRGRYFVDAASVNTGYWTAYRAPGFPFILSWVFRIHESVAIARLTVAACSAVTLICTWRIGRRLVGPAVGGLAALLAGISPWFVSMSTFVYIDGPGTMFSLLAVLAFLPVLDGRLHPGRLALCVAMAWIATSVRFGAPLCFGTGMAIVGLIAAVRAWRVRDRRRIVEIGGALAGAALSVPVLYMSGLFEYRGRTPAEANDSLLQSKGLTAATGWRDLTAWFRTDVLDRTGPTFVMAVLAVGLVASIVLAIARGRHRVPTAIFVLWGVSAVVGLVVSVGLIVTNYLMIAVPALSLAAATGLVGLWELTAHMAVATRRSLAGAAIAVLVLIGGTSTQHVSSDAHHSNLTTFRGLRAASVEVRRTLGPHCFTLTSYSPQVGWYSRCAGSAFLLAGGPGDYQDVVGNAQESYRSWVESDPNANPDSFAMITIEGGKRQPTDEQIAEADPFIIREIYTTKLGRRQITAVQFDPCIFEDNCPDNSGATP